MVKNLKYNSNMFLVITFKSKYISTLYFFNLSICISRTDFSPIGNKGFGIISVKGLSLVPNPPANIQLFSSFYLKICDDPVAHCKQHNYNKDVITPPKINLPDIHWKMSN